MLDVGSYKMLGKIVTVKVDRPINSIHPKHKDIIYPINYTKRHLLVCKTHHVLRQQQLTLNS